MTYDREEDLKIRLNQFLISRLSLPPEDYYSKLEEAGFLKLKSTLSDINNILTLKVTLAFVHWLSIQMSWNSKIREEVCENIRSTKPSSNGYDVEIRNPLNLIAEVKCNLPINGGNKYGSAQRDGILKDLNALANGKSKSPMRPEDSIRFMVFLDLPEIREATQQLLRLQNRNDIVEYKEGAVMDQSVIHVVYVPIGADAP